VRIGPPALPVYAQPLCPGPGISGRRLLAWNDGGGYYWVPGTWVVGAGRHAVDAGYWGFAGGFYGWHGGYGDRTSASTAELTTALDMGRRLRWRRVESGAFSTTAR